MSWPLSQNYNEAIQSPATNFADADLWQRVAATQKAVHVAATAAVATATLNRKPDQTNLGDAFDAKYNGALVYRCLIVASRRGGR
jgi:hypothetical protein